jgi:hypothetical protein
MLQEGEETQEICPLLRSGLKLGARMDVLGVIQNA